MTEESDKDRKGRFIKSSRKTLSTQHSMRKELSRENGQLEPLSALPPKAADLFSDARDITSLLVNSSAHPLRSQDTAELLSRTPLSVLLPVLGELGDLEFYRDHIFRRLDHLRDSQTSVQEQEQDGIRELLMLQQVAKWLSNSEVLSNERGAADAKKLFANDNDTYELRELAAIYQLGCLFLELGYLVAAERLFRGLVACGTRDLPSDLALGLVLLQGDVFEEAEQCFERSLQQAQIMGQAKIAQAALFVATKDYEHAKAVLEELHRSQAEITPAQEILAEALSLRASEG